jgi:MscS family membrane protein
MSERAAQLIDRDTDYLDLREVPPRLRRHFGIESAIQLKEVLDRIGLPPLEAVPGAAEIETLELRRQEPLRWRIPGTELDIARVTEGPRTGEYLFSPETVARIAADYEKVRALPYRSGASEGFHDIYVRTPGGMRPPHWLTWVGRLPEWSRSPTMAGQALYQWIGLALVVLLALAIAVAVRRWSRRKQPTAPAAHMFRKLLGPVVVGLATVAVAAFAEELNITGGPLAVVEVLASSVVYLTSAWAVLIVGNGVAESIISSPRIARTGIDTSFIRLVFRLSAGVASLLVIGYGARQLGVPLPAVIAGLGVGALALGLAAQPTVENLIGSFSLFADRPVRVGDFCQYGDRTGVVEEIGMRSTRIRGLDRTVTVVPNADFAKTQITNFSKRDRRLFQTTVRLRYGTTTDQLGFVLVKLRELLLAHPRILDESLRVQLADLGKYALHVEIFAYVDTTDWDEFVAIREEVLLGIIDVVNHAGAGFAFPSWTRQEASSLPPEFAPGYHEKIEGTPD